VSTVIPTRSRPALRRHHVVAVALSAPLVALLAVDWVVTGITGERTAITDDARAAPWFSVLMTGWLSLAFAALWVVLLAEGPRFAILGRVARGCRAVLLLGCPLMTVGNGVVYPLLQAFDVEDGPVMAVSDALAGAGLALTFVPALLLGLTQLRDDRLGVGGRLLSLGIPALLLTAAVGLLAEDWASPVLLTMSVLVGLATLGVVTLRQETRPGHGR
jgi:hypothetical protein